MTIAVHTRVDHLQLAHGYARDRLRWPVAPLFNPTDRWYACLDSDPHAEIWLLTWLPGQGTDLHDHGGSAGAFVIAEGALTEETVALGAAGAQVDTHEIAAGSGRQFGSHHVHRMTNRSQVPAISIHVYGPALATMNRYALDGRGLTRVATDRAGVSW